MKCIVGLGNPGNRYRFTRHNIGFRVVEAAIARLHARPQDRTELYESYTSPDGDSDLLIVMPQTYMNESGTAFKEVKQRYDLPLENMMVVFDDFQLPFGTLRMREKGSDGGHNGIASIMYHMASDLVPRLRIGVGGTTIPDAHTHELMAGYVLSRFTDTEEKLLPGLLLHAADALLSWADDGIAKTMSRFNKNFFNDADAS